MKHKSRLCAHVGTRQWRLNYWETYSSLVNWIIVRSLLAIASIHEFPSRSNDFLLAFTQSNHDADVFMEIHLGMVVDVSHAGTELTVIYILY